MYCLFGLWQVWKQKSTSTRSDVKHPFCPKSSTYLFCSKDWCFVVIANKLQNEQQQMTQVRDMQSWKWTKQLTIRKPGGQLLQQFTKRHTAIVRNISTMERCITNKQNHFCVIMETRVHFSLVLLKVILSHGTRKFSSSYCCIATVSWPTCCPRLLKMHPEDPHP